MDFIKRDDIKKNALPGRVVQNAVGHNSAVLSEKMTVSFCHYSAESGPMEPHNHAEESVVVLSCKDAADYIDANRIRAITTGVEHRISNLQQLAMAYTHVQEDIAEDDVVEDIAEDYTHGISMQQ